MASSSVGNDHTHRSAVHFAIGNTSNSHNRSLTFSSTQVFVKHRVPEALRRCQARTGCQVMIKLFIMTNWLCRCRRLRMFKYFTIATLQLSPSSWAWAQKECARVGIIMYPGASGIRPSGEGTLRERFLCSNHVPRIQIPTHRTLEREKCVLLQLPRPFLASYPED